MTSEHNGVEHANTALRPEHGMFGLLEYCLPGAFHPPPPFFAAWLFSLFLFLLLLLLFRLCDACVHSLGCGALYLLVFMFYTRIFKAPPVHCATIPVYTWPQE
jgi:hypothetical protein